MKPTQHNTTKKCALCTNHVPISKLFSLVPEKPKLMVSATDSGTVLVQWYTSPNPPTALLGYRLTFGRIDILPFTVVEFPTKENRYVAQDIHKGASYVFRLSARNKVGYGEEAEREVTTPEDAPNGYPENVVLEEASAYSLLLAWKSVPLIEQNGKITKFSVLYKDINSRGNASEVVVNAPGSTVLLEGLSADTVYDVRLCAFTAVGPGPYSPSVQFRTQRLDQGRFNISSLTTCGHYAGCNVPTAHERTTLHISPPADTSHPKCPFPLSYHCSFRPNMLFLKQGKSLGPVTLTVLSGTLTSLRLEINTQVRSLLLLHRNG